MTTVRETLRAWAPEFTALRQDLHAHPELGWKETRTAALVAARLREYGIAVTERVGGTGVVGVLHGRQSPLAGNRLQSVGLRADMDALPLTEQTGLPHASSNPGVMHACGHDGHTVMLLAAARYLAEQPDFAGTINFIFQPAEEGGRGGALAMINDGLFERFPCDAIYGLHNGPGMPAGEFGTRAGPLMAGAGNWDVTFSGTGGHGGFTPHHATDVTVVLGHFLLAIQTIGSRNVAPGEVAVISVGHLGGGEAAAKNVMPSSVNVGGTMRCFRDEVGQTIDARLRHLATTLAASSGCQADVRLDWFVPSVNNHPAQVETSLAAARIACGVSQVDSQMAPVTAGEDFAEMLRVRPGAFGFIGNGVAADGRFHALHSPLFNFNDAIIPVGAAYWVALAQQELSPTRIG